MSVIESKVVVVGHPKVGKTSTILRFAGQHLSDDIPIPMVFDVYRQSPVKYRARAPEAKYTPPQLSTQISISFWDTACYEDYDRLRPLSYPATDIILAFFSVDDKSSYTDIETRWLPEIAAHVAGVPIILVANKCELRGSKSTHLTTQDGIDLLNRIKQSPDLENPIYGYVEISAHTFVGINALIERILESLEHHRNPPLGAIRPTFSSKLLKMISPRSKTSRYANAPCVIIPYNSDEEYEPGNIFRSVPIIPQIFAPPGYIGYEKKTGTSPTPSAPEKVYRRRRSLVILKNSSPYGGDILDDTSEDDDDVSVTSKTSSVPEKVPRRRFSITIPYDETSSDDDDVDFCDTGAPVTKDGKT